MTKKQRQDLQGLVKQWRAKSDEFFNAMLKSHPVDRPRYEGECYALKWCADDLQNFLNTK